MEGPLGGYEEFAQFVSKLTEHRQSFKKNDTIAGLISPHLQKYKRNIPPWYIVTELVNPASAYYMREYPDIFEIPETERKLRFGSLIHDTAYFWFKKLPGFTVDEADVDGADIGIPGVRGRIDFRLNDVIVELKTTEREINGLADVIESSPQDLEQLLMYAILSSRDKNSHLLVYYNQSIRGYFRVFEVNIKNVTSVKKLITDRVLLLRHAIEKRDPSDLGQCRYYFSGCKFREAGVCDCENRNRLSTSVLEHSIHFARKEDIEEKLRNIAEKSEGIDLESFSLWDLFTPRRAYRQRLDSSFTEKLSYGDNYAILRKLNYAIYKSQPDSERRELEIDGIGLGSVEMLHIRESDSSEQGFKEMVVPVLPRVYNGTPSELNLGSLPSLYTARLSILAGLTDSTKGLLVVGFTGDPTNLVVLTMSFKDLAGIVDVVRKRLHALSTSITTRNFEKLPVCPSFVKCESSCLCPDKR